MRNLRIDNVGNSVDLVLLGPKAQGRSNLWLIAHEVEFYTNSVSKLKVIWAWLKCDSISQSTSKWAKIIMDSPLQWEHRRQVQAQCHQGHDRASPDNCNISTPVLEMRIRCDKKFKRTVPNALEVKELFLRPGRKDLLEQKRKEKAAQEGGLTRLSEKVQRTSFFSCLQVKVIKYWIGGQAASVPMNTGILGFGPVFISRSTITRPLMTLSMSGDLPLACHWLAAQN